MVNVSSVAVVEISAEPITPAATYRNDDGTSRVTAPKQNAYLHCGKLHPLPFTVKVPESGPYAPGRYLIGGDVFKTGQFGLDFRTSNMLLVPLSEFIKDANGPAIKAA